MTLEEMQARLAEINNELETATGDRLAELETEARGLMDNISAITQEAQRRQQLRTSIAAGLIPAQVMEQSSTNAQRQRGIYNASSPEYRSAFLRRLMGVELNEQERAAFTHTTANTGAVLPTTMVNRIWDLVGTNHPILGDVTIYRTGTTIELVKHVSITAGDAAQVEEGVANEDEQNNFAKIVLSGKDYAKTIKLSYATMAMSIDALEDYLINEISNRLGAAMAADLIAAIKAGINPGNKVTGEADYANLCKVMGALARVGAVTLYATRATIYTYLVGMVDTTGRPVFQPSLQAGAAGTFLGAMIKEEDGVEDGKILIGDPKKVVLNVIQDIMVERDRDIGTHVHIFSGYARSQGDLMDDKAFAELTVSA